MRKRTLIPLLVLGALIALTAALPLTPPGRNWLVGRAVEVLATNGIDVTVTRSGGNPYRRLRLDDIELALPGLEGSASTLELRYFLPSLLTAELPLSIRATGVDARLDLAQLALPSGGGGGAPVQVRFDALEVQDGRIAIADIPYTLPDLVIDELRIEGGGATLGVEARVSTPEGSARVAGRVGIGPFRADLEVQRADLAIARHWWDGIEGGVASGSVAIGPGEIRSDLTVRDGSLAFLGLAASGIEGSVRYLHPDVSADLRGIALGGPVSAGAEVAIDEQRWSGTLRGATDLGAAGAWLLRATDVDPSPFLTGSADVAIGAEGWTTVTLEGSARGSGTAAGLPLEELRAEFGYDAAGVTATASAQLAEGTVAVDFAPRVGAVGGGSQLQLTARGLQRGALNALDADGALRFGADGLEGEIRAGAAVALPDRRIDAEADARITPGEGWQLYLGGGDDRGGILSGAFVLQGSQLTGALNGAALELPGIDGLAEATLRADGPLDALPLHLELSGPAALRPRLDTAGGIDLVADLRGSAAATLRGSALEGIEGRFGPLTVAGAFDPAAAWRIGGSLDPRALRLEPTAAAGVELQVAVPAFELGRSLAIPAADDLAPPLAERIAAAGGTAAAPGGVESDAAPVPLRAAATVAVGALDTAGVRLPARRLELRWAAAGWRIVDPDGGSLTLGGGGGTATELALDALTVELAGRTVRLDGTASLTAAGASLQLAARSAGARVALSGDDAGYRADLTLEPGFAAAGVTLAEALTAGVDLTPGPEGGSALALRAQLGTLTADGSGRLGGPEGTSAELNLRAGTETLRGTFVDGGWRLVGVAELAPVAAALGLPALAGSATLDLSGPPGEATRPAGEVEIALQQPLAADATITLAGGAIGVEAAARNAPLRVQGALAPVVTLRADVGPLEGLALDGTELRGSGVLPAYVLARNRVAPQPWSLTGDIGQRSATLQVGTSRADLDWSGGWSVDARIDQPLEVGGRSATLGGEAAIGSDLPAAALDLVLALGADGALRAAGPLDALALSGRVTADALLAAAVTLPGGVTPRDDVTIDGELDLTALRYELRGRWGDAPFRAGGRGAELTAELELPAPTDAPGAGPLRTTVARGSGGTSLRIAAETAAPRALTDRLAGLPAGLTDALAALPLALDGELALDLGGGEADSSALSWSGALRLTEAAGESAAPVAVAGGIELVGSGATLALAADLRIVPQGGSALPPVRVDGGGTLLPSLDLTLDAAFAELRARATVSPGAEGDALPQLDAALAIPGLDGVVAIPALELTARSDGTTLRVAGVSSAPLPGSDVAAAIDLALTPTALAGSATLPLAIAGEALLLQLDLAGSPADPSVAAALTGALRGEGAYRSGTLAFDLAADPAALPSGALFAAPPTLRGSLDRSGAWSAALDANGVLAGSVVAIELTADGQALRYQGSGRVTAAGATLLPLELSGNGADATVRADLAGLDPAALTSLLGDATELSAAGELRASTSAPRLTVDARLDGRLGGLPAQLALTGGEDALALDASLAGVEVGIRPRSSGGVAISLLGERFEAAGFATLGERPTLQLRGALQGRSLRLDLAPPDGVAAFGSGFASLRDLPLQLVAASGDLEFEGSWSPAGTTASGAAPRLDLRLAAGGDYLVPLPLVAAVTLDLPAGSAPRATLAAELGAQGSPLRTELALAGALGGTLDLTGTVANRFLVRPAPLRIGGAPGAATVALTVPGDGEGELTLRAELRGIAPQRLALDGSAVLSGFAVEGSPEITWRPGSGFGGAARIQGVGPGAVPLRAALQGDGELGLELEAGAAERPQARLEVRLPADPLAPAAPLEGALTIDARGAAGAFGEQQLAAEVAIGGRLRAPEAQGPLRLSGSLEAQGEALFRDGRGRLTLDGPALTLLATSEGRTWSASGSVREAPLATLFAFLPGWLQATPLVAEATVRSDFEIQGGGAGGVSGFIDPLAVTTSRSRIEGRASLADALLANLQVALDLRDLPGALAGTVAGPVVLRAEPGRFGAAQLDAALELSELQLPGSDASVRGSLRFGGGLRDPRIDVTLSATSPSDAAGGELRLEVGESGTRGSLRSDLRLAGLSTDLRAAWSSDGIDADGSLAAAGASLDVTAEAAEVVTLRGDGALAGWSGTLEPTRAALELTGPLETLPGPASGTALLRVGPLRAAAASAPWAVLRVEDAAAAGISLGTLELLAAPAEPLRLTGDHLDASLAYGAPYDWTLALRDQPFPGGIVVAATGSGRGAAGTLDLALAGTGGLPLELAGRVAVEGGDGRLELGGSLAGGAAALRATLGTEGWRGELEIDGATVGPERVSLRGDLTGARTAPVLALTSDLAGPVGASGTLRAGPQGVTLEQRVTLPQVAGEIALTGALWPSPDLRLEATGGSALSLRAAALDAPLASSGVLTLRAGPAEVRLSGAGTQLELVAALPTVDARLEALLPSSSLAGIGAVLAEPLQLRGQGSLAGQALLTLRPALALRLDALSYRAPAGASPLELDLDGAVSLADGGTGTLSGELTLPAVAAIPALAEATRWRLAVERGADAAWSARIDGDVAEATLRADPSRELQIAVTASGDGLRGSASLRAAAGAGVSGEVALDRLLLPVAGGVAELTGALRSDGGLVAGELTAALLGVGGEGAGQLQLSGRYGFAAQLPAAYRPADAPEARSALLRMRRFDPAALPLLRGRVPNLTLPLSGTLQLEGTTLVGSVIAPEAAVSSTFLPVTIDATGRVAADEVRLQLQGTIDDSRFGLTAGLREAEGTFRLEGFPAEVIAEAVAGDTAIAASVTGALRWRLPYAAPRDGELRLATERVRLERGGDTTLGSVDLDYNDGVLTLRDVAFGAAPGEAGSWSATGVVGGGRLELNLAAVEADFGPLLQLVPALSRFGTSARGSFALAASGTLDDPDVTFESDRLEVEIAGGGYALEGARATLQGQRLEGDGTLIALAPVQAELAVRGGAQVSLQPLRIDGAQVGFDGAAEIPVLGAVQGIAGSISVAPQGAPQLDASARLGAPLTLRGTLAPLDLRLEGSALAVSAPSYFLQRSTVDLDVRLLARQGGIEVGGAVFVQEADFALGIRPPRDPAAATGAREAGGGRAARERVRFEGLRLVAPRSLSLNENFGSLEGRADLTLTGSAADPELAGTAEAVRGTVRFSGRDFTLRSAVASFEPSRGVFPRLAVEAASIFETSRVSAGAAGSVRFVVPRDGNRFEVLLTVDGEVLATPEGERAFSVEIDPELSSLARIEVDGSSQVASGPRALLASELLTLVTLGRVDISSEIIGQSDLATSVAQTALDTAVDLLVLSELQQSLSTALGVDVVEIRTTNLSELLAGGFQDPFSVSLRVGGYVSDEVFASFRIGSFDDEDQQFALTNEFSITYSLGPLDVDLAGRVNFASAQAAAPTPGLSATLGYDLSSLLSLETGVDLSTERSLIRLGVTLSW